MDLLGACWMIRSLEQSVSSVSFDGQNNLVAGGWDGQIRKWNSDGDLLWSENLPDRISEIIFHEDQIIVTSGLHIVVLNSKNGQINWQHPLEGSADSAIVENDEIYVTSSVYDIEHNDFLESAIWKFSLQGEQIWIIRMDERPWFILSHQARVIVGLGRPKSGWGEVIAKGEIINHQLDTSSPIMCGTKNAKEVLFGHADGTISTMKSTENKFLQSIETLQATEITRISSLEGGMLISTDKSSQEIWSANGPPISTQAIGFIVGENKTHWATRWSGIEGSLEVRNLADGSLITDSKIPQTRTIFSNDTRVVIGSEDGKIHVWEKDMFSRRFQSSGEEVAESTSKRDALKEKLRALRNK
jgi:WD40 repeat protein